MVARADQNFRPSFASWSSALISPRAMLRDIYFCRGATSILAAFVPGATSISAAAPRYRQVKDRELPPPTVATVTNHSA